MCWNNRPPDGPAISNGQNSGKIYTFDVASAVREMVKNPTTNNENVTKHLVTGITRW